MEAAPAAAAAALLPIDPNWLTFNTPESRWIKLPVDHMSEETQLGFIKLLWMISKNYKHASEVQKQSIRKCVAGTFDKFYKWIRMQHALKKMTDEQFEAIKSTVIQMNEQQRQQGGKRSLRNRKNKTQRKQKGGTATATTTSLNSNLAQLEKLHIEKNPFTDETSNVDPALLNEINVLFDELNTS